MTVEPIRSALSPVSSEDTSLVLPSDKNQRTGQQRVLEQVNTIKRSKSKMVKNDSIPTPTTPASVTEYSEPKFQFSPTKLNDTLFRFSNSNMTSSRMSGRSMSVRNTVRRQTQNSQWESQMNRNASQYNGLRRSDSDSSLSKAGGAVTQLSMVRSYTVRQNRATGQSMRLQENNMHASTIQSQESIRPSLSKSQTITKVTSTKNRSDALSASGVESIPNITMEKAVEYLSNSDSSFQLSGASFIQHHTFIEDSAKEQVWRLGGIPALIQLLKRDNPQLQQVAAAALRNIVFKDNNNKCEVEHCEGIEAILTLLRNTEVIETQRQLTGLLWNLSSADELKPEMIINVMPLLSERVVVPYNFWCNKNIDQEVFYNTTGCLRNLSCANDHARKLMRNCPQLIDSLMTYVQNHTGIDADDKSVENCVCILHNLSFRLEEEAPEHFTCLPVPEEKPKENNSKKSLFSPKSTKTQKHSDQEFNFPAMHKEKPEGVDWLYNRKSLQMYRSLLACSQKEATLEACCGALQNLTASKSTLSTLMSQSIIEKQGLGIISPLLNSGNPSLQKTAMSLVSNMSRVPSVRDGMAKQILPDISAFLATITPEMVSSDSSIATACRVMNTFMLEEPAACKKMINIKLVNSLSELSKNMSFDTARKAAGVLLWTMWGQKDIQNVLKKKGMNKDVFINEVTATAYKMATDINRH